MFPHVALCSIHYMHWLSRTSTSSMQYWCPSLALNCVLVAPHRFAWGALETQEVSQCKAWANFQNRKKKKLFSLRVQLSLAPLRSLRWIKWLMSPHQEASWQIIHLQPSSDLPLRLLRTQHQAHSKMLEISPICRPLRHLVSEYRQRCFNCQILKQSPLPLEAGWRSHFLN